MSESANLDPVVITLDVDWAHDFINFWLIDLFIEHQVKSTWFITHENEYLDKLREFPDLFEFAIHPNRLANSDHGSDDKAVLKYMKALVPEAVSMRTHGLYQTSNFLAIANLEYGIKFDSTIFLPGASHIEKHLMAINDMDLTRIPFIWADSYNAQYKDPKWEMSTVIERTKGIKIFDFHPLHLYLNSDSTKRYADARKKKPFNEWNESYLKCYRNSGTGAFNSLIELLQMLKPSGGRFLKEI